MNPYPCNLHDFADSRVVDHRHRHRSSVRTLLYDAPTASMTGKACHIHYICKKKWTSNSNRNARIWISNWNGNEWRRWREMKSENRWNIWIKYYFATLNNNQKCKRTNLETIQQLLTHPKWRFFCWCEASWRWQWKARSHTLHVRDSSVGMRMKRKNNKLKWEENFIMQKSSFLHFFCSLRFSFFLSFSFLLLQFSFSRAFFFSPLNIYHIKYQIRKNDGMKNDWCTIHCAWQFWHRMSCEVDWNELNSHVLACLIWYVHFVLFTISFDEREMKKRMNGNTKSTV